MLQEKNIEPNTDSPNVLLYAIILCVHYPLRICLVIYKLIKVAIVKTVSFPKQFLLYTLSALNFVEDQLEEKIINLLTYVITIPSYLFEKAIEIVSYPLTIIQKPKTNNKSESNQNTQVDEASSLGHLLSLTKRFTNSLIASVQTCETYVLATLLLPITILFYCLKTIKSLIYTTLNMSETEPETAEEKSGDKSLLNSVGDILLTSKEKALNYANLALTGTDILLLQIFDMLTSAPKHLYEALKSGLKRCQQALILSVLVAYSIGEYLILYLIFLFSILTKSRVEYKKNSNEEATQIDGDARFESERQALRQEIVKLKDALTVAMQLNESRDYEQKVNDLQKQLTETNAKFDKERAQYKQEIEKLQQNQSDNNVKRPNSFNDERKNLQDEIQRLQKLIAEVQKENEEENKLKKQEAINLDNERNQLQEQIQNLQQQVVTLQKRNESNALGYEESLKNQENEFAVERNVFRGEIKKLEEKVAKLERTRNEGKTNRVNNHTSNDIQMNNTDDDKTGPSGNSNKKKRISSNS